MILGSFEHDFVEESVKDSSGKLLTGQPSISEQGNTVWNAKVGLKSKLYKLCFSLCCFNFYMI